MAVHIFGASSSPSVTNFALKHTADRAKERYGPEVANTIHQNFYVDDCLMSVSNVNDAIQLISNLRKACKDGGFRLTKFTANSQEVLSSLPREECSKEVQAVELNNDQNLTERALGIKWNVNTDSFGFTVVIKDKPQTRRGLLSVISSVYDPLGFIAPFILPAKRILQDLCQIELGWDDELPENHKKSWVNWMTQLPEIEKMIVKRCIKPKSF